jgi:hypothetical protein
MKSNKNSFFRGVSMLLIIFALTFSTNAKANSPVTSSTLTNMLTSTVDVNIVPLQIYSLTGNWLQGFLDWLKDLKKCGTCGSTSCGGHSHGGGDNGGGTPGVPLDGGLGILALGAAAFGVRKLRGNKHDKI